MAPSSSLSGGLSKSVSQSRWKLCSDCGMHVTAKNRQDCSYCEHKINSGWVDLTHKRFKLKCRFSGADDRANVPASARLHPTVMRLLEIRPEVLVILEDTNIGLFAIPDDEINIDVVSISPCFLPKLNDHIIAQARLVEVRKASRVFVHLEKPVGNRALLERYLSTVVGPSICFCVGTSFDVLFMGKPNRITVSDIRTQRASDVQSLENVADQLEKLCIGMESPPIYYEDSNKWFVHAEDDDDEQRASMDRLFGLESQCKLLEKYIVEPLINGQQTTSVILYGPGGCGKSLLCSYMQEALRRFIVRRCDSLTSISGSSTALQDLESLDLLILDPLIPDNQASNLMTLNSVLSNVCMLVATQNVNNIGQSLRRYGRFAIEINVPLPTINQRGCFADHLLGESLSTSVKNSLIQLTHGYSYADLTGLVRNCCSDSTPETVDERGCAMIKEAQRSRPSFIREIVADVPKVTWDDIGGMMSLKQQLREMVIWPFTNADSFARLGIKPPTGVLLYGPPGCSKTLICQAVATECKLNFLSIRGPELFSKWVGESERAVRELFNKARTVRPSIIFFDEIDAIGANRGSDSGVTDRVLAQMLTEMDGLDTKQTLVVDPVIVIAATNRPEIMDPALLRPGRFDRLIYVQLPDRDTREAILKIHMRSMMFMHDCVDETELTRATQFLLDKTDGFSGAEVVSLCREAGMCALRQDINAQSTCINHFVMALESFSRSPASAHRLSIYETFGKKC